MEVVRNWGQGPYGEMPPKRPWITIEHDGSSFMDWPWCWELFDEEGDFLARGRTHTRSGAIREARRRFSGIRRAERKRARPKEKMIL